MIFRHLSYRAALRDRLEELRRERGRSFTQQALAVQMGVQKTYLSAVLAGRGDLNPDHLYLAAEFLELDEAEENFLHLLWSYERCRLRSRKQSLLTRIRLVQGSRLRTETAIRVDKVSDPDAGESALSTTLFLDPWASIVLTAFSVSKWQSDVGGLAAALGLEPRHLNDIVEALERAGVLAQKGGRSLTTERLWKLP